MEPPDDPKLRELLQEWKVENAPRSLDERVLGARQPWWKRLFADSVRVPLPIAVACAILFLVMAGALLRPRISPLTESPGASPTLELAGFQPVRDLQVRIIRSSHEN